MDVIQKFQEALRELLEAGYVVTIAPGGVPAMPAAAGLPGSAKRALANRAVELVAAREGLSAEDLLGRRRCRAVAWPRMMCYWLISQATRMPLQWVAEAMQKKDHGSVMYGREQVEHAMAEDALFAEKMRGLLQELSGKTNT